MSNAESTIVCAPEQEHCQRAARFLKDLDPAYNGVFAPMFENPRQLLLFLRSELDHEDSAITQHIVGRVNEFNKKSKLAFDPEYIIDFALNQEIESDQGVYEAIPDLVDSIMEGLTIEFTSSVFTIADRHAHHDISHLDFGDHSNVISLGQIIEDAIQGIKVKANHLLEKAAA